MVERFKQFVEQNLSGKTLVIVSNREPYAHKRSGLSLFDFDFDLICLIRYCFRWMEV